MHSLWTLDRMVQLFLRVRCNNIVESLFSDIILFHTNVFFFYFLGNKIMFSLNNVHESNTLFVHVFLYQCVKSLIYLPSLFEMIYVEMPEIMNILFIKVPGTELCTYSHKFIIVTAAVTYLGLCRRRRRF